LAHQKPNKQLEGTKTAQNPLDKHAQPVLFSPKKEAPDKPKTQLEIKKIQDSIQFSVYNRIAEKQSEVETMSSLALNQQE
jgi:type IV secretory pathway VirD2 relaxase